MNKLSRRALARYAVDRLLAGVKPSSLAAELAAVLVESGRGAEAEFLLQDIAWELEARRELVMAKITSVTPLSKALEVELSSQLKKATAAKAVYLEKELDRSLLGGLRIETAAHIWDLSVTSDLNRLREEF